MDTKTVKELREKCKELGLATTGKKIDLEKRIRNHCGTPQGNLDFNGLSSRLDDLQTMIEQMSGNKQPPLSNSSPIQTPMGQTVPAFTTSASQPISFPFTAVAPAPVYTFAQPHNGHYNNHPSTYVQSSLAGYQTPRHQFGVNLSGVGSGFNSVPHYGFGRAPEFIPTSQTTAYYSQRSELPNEHQHEEHLTSNHDPYQNEIRYVQTSLPNIRDVIDILPEFDPLDKKSLNSEQFIKRIANLREAYQWPEKILLLAVPAKMKGAAKLWIDGLPEIFITWNHFTQRFLSDFPNDVNEADIHLEMASCHRGKSQIPEHYYYQMVAMGRKAGLQDNAIIRYIVRGLGDAKMQHALSGHYFPSLTDLLKSIRAYDYKYVAPASVAGLRSLPERQVIPQRSQKSNFRCFNCNETGHISVNCTKPQRRDRCSKCNRMGHVAANCFKNNSGSINKIDSLAEQQEGVILKNVIINDSAEVTSIIDPGSTRSLIRKSIAEKLAIVSPCVGVSLKGFAGGEYRCLSKINCELKLDELKYRADLYLVEDELLNNDILLGTDVLCHKDNRVIIEEGKCRVEQKPAQLGDDLSLDEREHLDSILSAYSHCFAESMENLGKCNFMQMKIELTTDVPFQLKPYKIPFARREAVKAIVDNLLDFDIIRQSNSPYSSPVVLVGKKNGEFRLCVDFRKLNSITVKHPTRMPVVDEMLARLAGNRYFTVVDMLSGYHQIEIEEASKKFTAFVTDEGLYEYNRVPYGLADAPLEFQKAMDALVARMERGEAFAFMDDVVIVSKTVSEGLERLEKFLSIVNESGFSLRKSKCVFLAKEIQFLGHRVREDTILPGEGKLTSIKDFPELKNVHDVRRFLGLTGFFRKFVKEYSIIAQPLSDLLKKDVKFFMDKAQTDAFDALREALSSEPVLAIYDPSAKHEVHTDASSIGLAGILMQTTDGKNYHPVFYFSRKCSNDERKYHSYELEVLAIVETLERFKVYLLGKPFKVITDCSAITTTKLQKELLPKIARWWLKLQEYDFTLEHRTADRMRHVDAMSRAPSLPSKEPEIVRGSISRIDISKEDWFASMQQYDQKLINITEILSSECGTTSQEHLREDFTIIDGRLYRLIDGDKKLVIPRNIRWRVVQYCHDECGHFGINKTMQRILKHFWFHRMRRYVKQYISSCLSCAYNKGVGGKPLGELCVWNVDPIPFKTLHIDHLGPFVKSRQGNSYVLAISDAFTKYLVVKAVRSTKTQPVIRTLNELTSYFGLPLIIVSDRGTGYTSKLFQEYCRKNNIRHIQNAVRSPRSNGQVERANRTILDYLRTSVEDESIWDLKLLDLQWSINSQQNSTTGFSPNELVFDFNIRNRQENILIDIINQNDVDDDEQSISKKRELAAVNIQKQKERWKQRFDQKHMRPLTYSIGDLVLVEFEPPATGTSRKLEPKFRGPYMVVKCLGNHRYVIEDAPGNMVTSRQFNSVYSADRLKPWCTPAPELDELLSDDDIEVDGNL